MINANSGEWCTEQETKRFEFKLRVYYEDTDSGGVVYYANYFKFTERGRTEMFRSFGIESQRLATEKKIALTVRSCEAEFKKPAKLDDLLTVSTKIRSMGGASINLEQKLTCNDYELVKMHLKLVCISLEGRPARLPEQIRKSLKQFCNNN